MTFDVLSPEHKGATRHTRQARRKIKSRFETCLRGTAEGSHPIEHSPSLTLEPLSLVGDGDM